MRISTRPKRRPPTTIPTQRSQHDAELVDEMGALLDEIDGILNEEEQFAMRFRQKSGQ